VGVGQVHDPARGWRGCVAILNGRERTTLEHAI
jgi:hypothetical protein